jgi:hypothetical protein
VEPIIMLALLLGAPAFTAGLCGGNLLPEIRERTRLAPICFAVGAGAGIPVVVIVTAGQALGHPTELWFLTLVAWNVVIAGVGVATGYGYGWMLTDRSDSKHPHRRWLLSVTISAAAAYLLVGWVVSSLDPTSDAMAVTPAPSPYQPPAHPNKPDYTLPARCAAELQHPPPGRRLPECQWLALDGNVAWVQDQMQQVFEWGDTCGIVRDSDGTPVAWNRPQLARCLDPALPPLVRSATQLTARIDQVMPPGRGPCRSAIAALRPWPRAILDDAASLDGAANRGDAAAVQRYLAKLDRDLAPGTLGYGRVDSTCRVV